MPASSNVLQGHPVFTPERKTTTPRFGSTRFPDILNVSDIDDTFLPWKTGQYNIEVSHPILEKLKAAFLDLQDRFINAFVTGRGLSSMKRLAHFFKDVPVQFLALDNGKHLFINRRNEPAEKWIGSLSADAEDQDWKNHLKTRAKWDHELLLETAKTTLTQDGFQGVSNHGHEGLAMPEDHIYQRKVPNYPNPLVQTLVDLWRMLLGRPAPALMPLNLMINPDESAFHLLKGEKQDRKFYTRWGDNFAKTVATQLARHNNPVQWERSDHGHYLYYFFTPKTIVINKASVVDFLLRQKLSVKNSQHLKAVLTYGDSQNDIPLLSRRHFTTVDGRKLPVFPTLSGTKLLDNIAVKTHPRLIVAQQNGDLVPAMTQHLTQVGKIQEQKAVQ
jgi:hydroxymethylpyrimidine pyrophosphatase-like HAD family hydrolase